MRHQVPSLALILGTALAAAPLLSAQTTFVDVAPARGVDKVNLGRGSAMVDLDGDGLLDLLCTSGYGGIVPGDHTVLQQQGNGNFTDVTTAWGFGPDSRETFSVVAADFDEDGDVDLYFANGGFTNFVPDQVMRNDLDGSGVFTDVSPLSGPLTTKAFGATALDYDKDGDLDVFVSNNAFMTPQPCNLLRNDGGMAFMDVSVAAGITHLGTYRHCGAGDYDDDGWTDMAAGNFIGPNRLYRNLGDGTFDELASSAGVASLHDNYGFVFADFDQDAQLDVFLPKWQPTPTATPTSFFLNDGDGTFTDVTTGAGTGFTTDMGHNVHDVDADGHPDVFIGTGWPPEEHDDILYRMLPDGQGGLTAIDDSAASGILANGPSRCHGVSFGDVDDDGDIDIYLNLGGMAHNPDSVEANALWLNQGNGNSWLAVDLDGQLSPNMPAGARTTVLTNSDREVHGHYRLGSGFGNTDSPSQHLGLAGDLGAKRLTIRWPSGIEQIVLNPPVQQRFSVVETGLIIEGDPAPGASLELRMCGPDQDVAELFIGTVPISQPMPAFGGILGILPPFVGPIPIPLGSDGIHESTEVLPNDPGLSGLTALAQAWVHPIGVSPGGALTNVVTLVFP
jgi:hypothetical protein